MALKPRVRKSAPAVVRGHAVSSPRKVKCLKAFSAWLRALERSPSARLSTFARQAGVRSATVWKYVRSDPAIAARYVAEIAGHAEQGLMQAIQRGLDVLALDGTFYNDEEEGRVVNERDVALLREQRAWFETFAKYVHGGFKKDGGKDGERGATVNVNIGIPAHVIARMGLDDEKAVRVDAELRKTEGLVDGL